MDPRYNADMALFHEISYAKNAAEKAKSKADDAADFDQWDKAVLDAEEAFKTASKKITEIKTPHIAQAAEKFLTETHQAYRATVEAIHHRLEEKEKKYIPLTGLPISATMKTGKMQLTPGQQNNLQHRRQTLVSHAQLLQSLLTTTHSRDKQIQASDTASRMTIGREKHPTNDLFKVLDQIAGSYQVYELNTKEKMKGVRAFLMASQKKVDGLDKQYRDIGNQKSTTDLLAEDQQKRDMKSVMSEAKVECEELKKKHELLSDFILIDNSSTPRQISDNEENEINRLMDFLETRIHITESLYRQAEGFVQKVQDTAGYHAEHLLGINAPAAKQPAQQPQPDQDDFPTPKHEE